MSTDPARVPAERVPAEGGPAERGRARPGGLRPGHLAGGLLIVVGLAGLWHAAQATAAAPVAPQVAGSAPAQVSATRAGITVSDAYLQPQEPTDALAYLTVTNRGKRPDALLALSSDEIAHVATLYSSGAETATEPLSVPPRATVRLTPGGPHFRLGLHGPLAAGQSAALTLTFRRAGDLTVRAVVR